METVNKKLRICNKILVYKKGFLSFIVYYANKFINDCQRQPTINHRQQLQNCQQFSVNIYEINTTHEVKNSKILTKK